MLRPVPLCLAVLLALALAAGCGSPPKQEKKPDISDYYLYHN